MEPNKSKAFSSSKPTTKRARPATQQGSFTSHNTTKTSAIAATPTMSAQAMQGNYYMSRELFNADAKQASSSAKIAPKPIDSMRVPKHGHEERSGKMTPTTGGGGFSKMASNDMRGDVVGGRSAAFPLESGQNAERIADRRVEINAQNASGTEQKRRSAINDAMAKSINGQQLSAPIGKQKKKKAKPLVIKEKKAQVKQIEKRLDAGLDALIEQDIAIERYRNFVRSLRGLAPMGTNWYVEKRERLTGKKESEFAPLQMYRDLSAAMHCVPADLETEIDELKIEETLEKGGDDDDEAAAVDLEMVGELSVGVVKAEKDDIVPD